MEKQIYVQTPGLGNQARVVTRQFGRTLGVCI